MLYRCQSITNSSHSINKTGGLMTPEKRSMKLKWINQMYVEKS